MLSLKNLLFLATSASALAIVQRTPADILNDLKTIDSNTNSLTGTVNGWDGSIAGAIPIQSSESTLAKSIDSATTAAKSEPVASSADSQSIISYISGTLEPDIVSSFTALKNRKADFASSGLQTTVLNDLKDLKSKTDSLGAALKAAASSDQQSAAQAIQDKIDGDFDDAISAFS